MVAVHAKTYWLHDRIRTLADLSSRELQMKLAASFTLSWQPTFLFGTVLDHRQEFKVNPDGPLSDSLLFSSAISPGKLMLCKGAVSRIEEKHAAGGIKGS